MVGLEVGQGQSGGHIHGGTHRPVEGARRYLNNNKYLDLFLDPLWGTGSWVPPLASCDKSMQTVPGG